MAREVIKPFSSAAILEQTRARTHVHPVSRRPTTLSQIDVTDPAYWDDPAYAHQVIGRRLGEFNSTTIAVIMDEARHACESCGKSNALHAHHILPLGIARKHFSHIAPSILAHFANCQILCAKCHVDLHRVAYDQSHYQMVASGLLYAVESSIRLVIVKHNKRF